MYDKLLTLLSACESLVQRFEDLRYVGMQDQVDKPSVLPKTYGAYHDAFRTWQLYSAETRQCMEELNAMPAFRASLAVFGEAASVVEAALSAADTDESEAGYAALKLLAEPKAELQMALSGLQLTGMPGCMRASGGWVVLGTEKLLAAAALVREEIGSNAESASITGAVDYQQARSAYHAALSSVETKLAELKAILDKVPSNERPKLNDAFQRFTAFVETTVNDLGQTLPSDWNTLVAEANQVIV